MLSRISRHYRRSAQQPAAAAGRRDRRSDPVSGMDRGRQFHAARRARLFLHREVEALDPSFETGLGLLRSRDVRLLQRWNQPLTITPEIRAFLEQPKLLIVTKATIRSRVHRRVYLDYIGIKRFDRDGKLIGERRFCGLFTSTAYTRPARAIPLSAAQDRQRHSPRRLRSVEPFRQGAGQRARDLSARRSVSDRRGHALSVRARHPAARRAAARARAAAARPLRPLRVGHRLCSARPLRQQDQGGDRQLSCRGTSTAGRAPTIRSFRKGRWCASITSSAATRARRRTRIAHRSTAPSKPSCAVGSTACAKRLLPVSIRRAGSALFARYRDAFPIDYREVYPPATALTDIGVIETLTPERPLGVELYRDESGGPRSAGLKVFSHNRPIPLSERVPVLENMGFRVVDERTYHIEPKDSDEVWFHDMTLESALGQDFDLAALKDRLEACFLVVMSKRAESDGYNALVLANGLGWRDVALIRTMSRFLRQVRVPFSQDYMWTTLRKYSGLAAQIVSLFQARFDPRLAIAPDERGAREAAIAASIETRLAGGREPRRGSHPAPLRQRGHRRDPHQFLSDRPRRLRQGSHRDQVLQPQGRRHAVAAAALRNLRLFAARRSRAFALRQSGARRHSLVRPAAGFPHRSARPGQSAERQERRDRAGRRQGRLRAEISAGRRPARGHPGGRHRHLQVVHLDAARHHRQYRHRNGGRDPAARCRAP